MGRIKVEDHEALRKWAAEYQTIMNELAVRA